jgi:type I restriction enzyme S subunit
MSSTAYQLQEIGKIARFEYGKSQANVRAPDGRVPVYGTGGLLEYANAHLHPGPSIIVGRKGSLGNPIFSPGPFWAVDTTYYAAESECNLRWLFYVLCSLRLENYNEATGVPSLARPRLNAIRVPVPALQEQDAIVQVLSAVDRAIEQTEALLAKQQRIKAGLMHDLLTRGIDAQGRIRDPLVHRFKPSILGLIPEEWDVKPLAQCTQAPITYGIVQAGKHVLGGVPYIRTGDMTGDELNGETMLRTSREIASHFKRSEVRTGEIVCAIRAIVGKVLPVPESLDGANLTQGTARISPNSGTNSRFLLWSLRAYQTQQEIGLQSKGTTFAEITLANLRRIPVVIPRDLLEQALIAQFIDRSDTAIAETRMRLSKLKRTKSGMMQDLLTGRVPVTPLLPDSSQ